jgi:hypothetical protein
LSKSKIRLDNKVNFKKPLNSSGAFIFRYFLTDDFTFNNDTIIAPVIIPAITERKITIARDASNFQKRNVIATGMAFCTENIATVATIINNRIIVAMVVFPYIPYIIICATLFER